MHRAHPPVMSVRIYIHRNDWRPLSVVQKEIIDELFEESGLSGKEDRHLPFDEKHGSEYEVRLKDLPLLYPVNANLVKKTVEAFNHAVNTYPGRGYRLYSEVLPAKPQPKKS